MTAFRDVVIRVKTEQQKAKLEAPKEPLANWDAELLNAVKGKKAHEEAAKAVHEHARAVDELNTAKKKSVSGGPIDWGLPSDEAYHAQRDAINEAAKAEAESTAITREHTKVTQEFGSVSIREYAKVGSGVLGLARGISLLAISSSETTKQMLEMFVVIEGGVAATKGLGNIFTGLSSIAGGPLAVAFTALTAAITAGALAWSHYANKAEEARKKTEEAAKASREADALEQDARRRAQDILTGGDLARVGNAQTPGSRRAAIEAAISQQENIIGRESGPGGNAKILADALERNSDLIKQRTEIDRQAIQDEQALFGKGFAGQPMAPGQGAAGYEQRLNDLAAKTEAALNKITDSHIRALQAIQKQENAAMQ